VSVGIRSYRDLIVWQKGIALTKAVYELTHSFPRQETFALASQLQRAAVSVPSNIAEGQARQHTGEFRHFLYLALGSLAEVDTQMTIAQELGYITLDEYQRMDDMNRELRKMLHTLIRRLPNPT
jgi:four helix bundle protein